VESRETLWQKFQRLTAQAKQDEAAKGSTDGTGEAASRS
jgi:hypothetical protein